MAYQMSGSQLAKVRGTNIKVPSPAKKEVKKTNSLPAKGKKFGPKSFNQLALNKSQRQPRLKRQRVEE